MKKTILSSLILFVFAFCSSDLLAQKDYELFFSEDHINFSQKWKSSKIADETSLKELRLRIENSDTVEVKIVFTVGFYFQSILKEESEEITLCLKPGKNVKGKFGGLIFEPAGFTNKQLASPEFSWEFTKLDIFRNESCK